MRTHEYMTSQFQEHVRYDGRVAQRIRRLSTERVIHSSSLSMINYGIVAQMVERPLCMWEVVGSMPTCSSLCRDSIAVSIPACHAGDLGSSPNRGETECDDQKIDEHDQLWDSSSDGRAPALHVGGSGIDAHLFQPLSR